MAMNITYGGKHHVGWWVGKDLPPRGNVTCVTADGDELELIKTQFKNLPHPPICNKVGMWRNDWAQFIVDNLPNKRLSY